MEKLDSVLFLTSDPAAANMWPGHVPDGYLSDAERLKKAVETISQIMLEMWIDPKTKESLELCKEVCLDAYR